MEKYIANLMIAGSREIVLKHMENWMKEKHPDVRLEFRIGSGKSTYHQRKRKDYHSITYGQKTISSKLHSKSECERWLTTREILDRGYFGGIVNIQHALTNVVLHEIAHFVQVLNEKREFGSVHNEDFYKILDRMHLSGVAESLLLYLQKDKRFSEMSFGPEEITKTFTKDDISTGQLIGFLNRRGQIVSAHVEKKNKKTLIVNTGFEKYKISYPLVKELM